MYRKLSSNSQNAATFLSLKYLLRDLKDVQTKQFYKLNSEEINQILGIHQLESKWAQTQNGVSLSRKYEFQSFQDSFSFMAQVSQIAEEIKHYPKWFNKNGLVTVDLTTPDVKGVTIKDVILAYTSDHIANVINGNQKNSIFDRIDIHVDNLINSWNNNYSQSQEFNRVLDRSVNFL